MKQQHRLAVTMRLSLCLTKGMGAELANVPRAEWLRHRRARPLLTFNIADGSRAAQICQNRIGATNSTFSASPIASGGRIYFSSEDGEVFVNKAGPEYELLAVNRMGEPLMATPAASDGVLVIRANATCLRCASLASAP